MSYNTLVLAYQDGICQLTFNRPDKRNAISYELMDEMIAALEEVKNSSAQVLILTGAGNAFCSGMDLENLKAITSRTPEENIRDSQTMAQMFRAIYDFPKLTIAAVNGPAIAGGCGVATLCDFTIASTAAKFGYTEVRIGFLPAIVSAWLVRQIGDKAARKLLLTGNIISAEEALTIGLITEVVEPDKLLDRAREIALQLLKNSPTSLVMTKQLLNSYAHRDLEWQVDAAVEANAAIRATADFREGISSFLEKRKPKWTGGSIPVTQKASK
jgi:methylglutaconyl-CoA hydratase